MLYSEELPWPDDLKPFQSNDTAIQRDPYRHYAWMRDNAPVLRAQSDTGDIYFLTRHADIRQALRDNKRFSSATVDPALLPWVITQDPPDHTRLRLSLAKAFTPKAIGAMESFVRDFAKRLISQYMTNDKRQFAKNVVTPLTVGTIGEMIGVSVERIDLLQKWSNDILSYLGRIGRGTPGVPGDEEGFREMLYYLKDGLRLAEERSNETIAGNLARLSLDGSVTEFEALANISLLLIAGHETSSILLMNLIILLAENPDMLAKLKDDPKQSKLLVEEMLRFKPSSHRVARIATEDVAIDEYRIPAGSSVRLLLGAANRDERFFPEPDAYKPERDTTGHLAFGTGLHMCLGAFLARMEATVLLETIAECVAEIHPDPNVQTTFYEGGAFANVGPTEAGIRLYQNSNGPKLIPALP